VHEVLPASPAASAGVRPGDALVALDGRSAAEMSLAAVRRLLRSESGRVVRVVLARDGATSEVALTLRRVV
jgi:C-terminal processing protease CtpA/Prc